MRQIGTISPPQINSGTISLAGMNGSPEDPPLVTMSSNHLEGLGPSFALHSTVPCKSMQLKAINIYSNQLLVIVSSITFE